MVCCCCIHTSPEGIARNGESSPRAGPGKTESTHQQKRQWLGNSRSRLPRVMACHPRCGVWSCVCASRRVSMSHHAVAVRRKELMESVIERSEEHTSELQSHLNLVCRLLLEKKKT